MTRYEIKFNVGLETSLVVEGEDEIDATNLMNDYYINGNLLQDFKDEIYDPNNLKFKIVSIKETNKKRDLFAISKIKAKDPMLFVSCLKKYYPVILTDIMKIV